MTLALRSCLCILWIAVFLGEGVVLADDDSNSCPVSSLVYPGPDGRLVYTRMPIAAIHASSICFRTGRLVVIWAGVSGSRMSQPIVFRPSQG